MIPLQLPRPQGRALGCWSSAPTPTTSRSAAAGPSCTGRLRAPAARHLGGAGRPRGPRTGGGGQRGRAQGRGADHRGPQGVPGRLSLVRGGGQGGVRGPEASGRARPGDRPLPRRRPPGPPAGRGADLEHLPRPSRARVRDPQVRRRPGPAEPVRAAAGGAVRAQGGLLLEQFPSQRDRRWFTPTRSGPCCACAAWSATRPQGSPRGSTAARRRWSRPRRGRRLSRRPCARPPSRWSSG